MLFIEAFKKNHIHPGRWLSLCRLPLKQSKYY